MADRKTEPDCIPRSVDGTELPPEIKGAAILPPGVQSAPRFTSSFTTAPGSLWLGWR